MAQLPHFLIIGTQKGGTSSLYHALTQHPQILPAARKEVHFFDQFYARGADWYADQFPACQSGQITGEASPFYLAHPRAAERIATLLPQVRLIVLLRNPADRAISHYHHMCRRQIETLSMADALAQEAARTAQDWAALADGQLLTHSNAQRYSYRARGYYATQLQRYLSLFSRDQILMLCSEAFFAEPLATVQQCYRFLGVASNFVPDDLQARKPGHYDVPEQSLRQALLHDYAPQNEALFQLIGQRFDWQ